jgi:DNA-directed RNA polymerase omega subunit
MARITSEAAANMIGGDRFLLVLVASQRTRELSRGSRPKIDPEGHSHSVVALKEIEQGLYTVKDYYNTLDKKGKHNEHHSTQSKRNSERDIGFDPID